MAGKELGAGAWSYFGDPRAISHDGHTFTGWVSTVGHIWVARLLHTVMLGDLVSLCLAARDGVDPGPIEVIDRLKDELDRA